MLRAIVRKHGVALTAVLTVLVFLGLFLYADAGDLVTALRRVPLRTFGVVIGITTVGYGFRFAKWHLYLRTVGIDLSVRLSALTFFSGLMMVVTPGKAGELWKAWYLSEHAEIPVNQTASVVGAERLTDLIGLGAMALTGVYVFQRSSTILVGLFVVIMSGILLLQWRWFCLTVLDYVRQLPVLGRFADTFADFYESTYALFRPQPLIAATVLSVLAWGLEGVALWYILSGFDPAASPVSGIFVFGLGSIIGALSFLPGGLGAAEASMVGLLQTFGYPDVVAVAVTIIIRVGTLWYAAILGTTIYLTSLAHRQ